MIEIWAPLKCVPYKIQNQVYQVTRQILLIFLVLWYLVNSEVVNFLTLSIVSCRRSITSKSISTSDTRRKRWRLSITTFSRGMFWKRGSCNTLYALRERGRCASSVFLSIVLAPCSLSLSDHSRWMSPQSSFLHLHQMHACSLVLLIGRPLPW